MSWMPFVQAVMMRVHTPRKYVYFVYVRACTTIMHLRLSCTLHLAPRIEATGMCHWHGT